MTQETKVKITLDTRQAQSDLRNLTQQSSRTSMKIGKRLRGVVRGGLRMTGLGVGIGAGVQAVRGASESGFGDVFGELLGGVGAQLAETIFGDLDETARATKSAREETIQAFGSIAGSMNGGKGGIPPGAREFFSNVRSLRMDEERGREIFEREFRADTEIGDIITRIIEGLGTLIDAGFTRLGEILNPFDGK